MSYIVNCATLSKNFQIFVSSMDLPGQKGPDDTRKQNNLMRMGQIVGSIVNCDFVCLPKNHLMCLTKYDISGPYQ